MGDLDFISRLVCFQRATVQICQVGPRVPPPSDGTVTLGPYSPELELCTTEPGSHPGVKRHPVPLNSQVMGRDLNSVPMCVHCDYRARAFTDLV